MTGDELLKAAGSLEEYLSTYDPLLGRKENKEHFRQFARGQLGTIERKSLEPMADAEKTSARTLQLFFSKTKWDEEAVRDELQRRIAEQYGGADAIFVIDPTSDAKKGKHTAGVERQYCGESGKIDNCIVTVHLGYTRGDFRALIDGRLYLPKSWDWNPDDPEVQAKRKAAGIPKDVVYQSKMEIAYEQLAQAKVNGFPGRFVTADEDFGGKPWFRDAVGGLGLYYVFEVPRTTRGVVYPPFHSGEALEPLTVEALGQRARGLRLRPWERFRVHLTEKGPEVWEFKATPFWEARGDSCASVKWLLIGRNVQTRELKYFLANAPPGTPIEVLIRVAFARWIIERCFEDCKSELGLNHAETRKYRAIQRHLILTAVNYFFLQDWVLRAGGGKKDGPHGDPVRRCDSGAA